MYPLRVYRRLVIIYIYNNQIKSVFQRRSEFIGAGRKSHYRRYVPIGAVIRPRKAYTPQPDGQTAAAGADQRNITAFCLLLLRLLIVITTSAQGAEPGQIAAAHHPYVFSWHRFFETDITVCSSLPPHIHNQSFNRPALDGQGSQERVSQRDRGKEGKIKICAIAYAI